LLPALFIYVFVYLFLLLCCFQDKQVFRPTSGFLMIFFGQYQYVGKPTKNTCKCRRGGAAPIFIQGARENIFAYQKSQKQGKGGAELKAHEA